MASSPAPTYPDHATRQWTTKRSVTLPAYNAPTAKPAKDTTVEAADGVDVLYAHPGAAVIKFTTFGATRSTSASANNSRPSSSSGSELPWVSPGETTIAAGPLRIYRVPGSVAFLQCRDMLHAIMPRSQCWCVDGVSKFALRVLPDTYYRIELPGVTEEDLSRVEQLKMTLSKVLFYERSACPFSRTFGLDLPEMPDVKKRGSRGGERAKKWKLDRAWRPDGHTLSQAGSTDDMSGSGSSPSSDCEAGLYIASTASQPDVADGVHDLTDVLQETATRAFPHFSAEMPERSVSSPIQLHAALERFSRQIPAHINVDGAIDAIESAEAGHRARFDAQANLRHASQAVRTSMPLMGPPAEQVAELLRGEDVPANDSPVDPVVLTSAKLDTFTISSSHLDMDSISVQESSDCQIHLSDETKAYIREIESQEAEEVYGVVRRASNHYTDASIAQMNGRAVTETPRVSDSVDNEEKRDILLDDPYAAIRARIQARRSIGGTTTFHPAHHKGRSQSSTSSTSSTGTMTSTRPSASQSSSMQHQALVLAFAKKACAAIVSPPANLVALMLRIAVRFAHIVFGVDGWLCVETAGATPRRVPGSFGREDALSSEEELDEEDEDDFGVPIRSPVRLARQATASTSEACTSAFEAASSRRRNSSSKPSS